MTQSPKTIGVRSAQTAADSHYKRLRPSRSLGCVLASLCFVAAFNTGCDTIACVERGTLVVTPQGQRPIEDLSLGDEVVSIDPFSGTRTTTTVARVRYALSWCEKLQLGDRSLWLTAEHPVYSPERGAFEPASEWFTGTLDQVQEGWGGGVAARGGSWFEQRPCRVVDLTVSDSPHTFLANGIVVHNKSPVPECFDDTDCGPDEFCEFEYCTPCESAPPDLPRCIANNDAGIGGRDGAGGSAAATR